jgi:hypothetical protein
MGFMRILCKFLPPHHTTIQSTHKDPDSALAVFQKKYIQRFNTMMMMMIMRMLVKKDSFLLYSSRSRSILKRLL